MAFRLRSFALAAMLAIDPSMSTFASTGSAELPVSLTVYDICTLDTRTFHPTVACSAGGQFRVMTGEYFASFRVADVKSPSVVEIAF